MLADYLLTLTDTGEDITLPQLPVGGEDSITRARRLIQQAVYDLAQTHETSGVCESHHGLSVRRVNRRESIVVDYRVRFRCTRPDGTVEWRTGTTHLVDRERVDTEYAQALTETVQAYAEVIHRAENQKRDNR